MIVAGKLAPEAHDLCLAGIMFGDGLVGPRKLHSKDVEREGNALLVRKDDGCDASLDLKAAGFVKEIHGTQLQAAPRARLTFCQKSLANCNKDAPVSAGLIWVNIQ